MASVFALMSAHADEVVFDFTSAESIEALGFTAPGEGAATEVGTTPIVKGDVTITPTKEGTTTTRFWQSGGASAGIYDFRAYSNAELTFSVPEGKTITSIACVDNSKWTAPTPTSGAFDGKTWTGNAQSVAFAFTGQCRFKTITVTFGDGEGEVTPDPVDNTVKVGSIAEALELPAGTEVILEGGMDNAYVCLFQYGKYSYFCDFNYGANIVVYGTIPQYSSCTIIDQLAGTIAEYKGGKQLVPNVELFGEATDYAEYGYTLEMIGYVPTEGTLDDVVGQLGLHAAWYKFYDLTVTEVSGKNFKVSDGTTEIAGYNQFGITLPAVGDVVNVECFLSSYNGAIQLYPTKMAGLVELDLSGLADAEQGTLAKTSQECVVVAQYNDEEYWKSELWVAVENEPVLVHIQADNFLDATYPLGTVLKAGIQGEKTATWDGTHVFLADATTIEYAGHDTTISPVEMTMDEPSKECHYAQFSGVHFTGSYGNYTMYNEGGELYMDVASGYGWYDMSEVKTDGTKYTVTGIAEKAGSTYWFYPMGAVEEGVADGINTVATTTDNAVYNLAGQRVNNAQKGIFIHNGKKVIK